jgi:hypothetical protein
MRTVSCDEPVVAEAQMLPVSPMAESMAIAVLGAEAFRNGNCLLDNPRIFKVFTHDATVRAVDLGAGLWSATRSSADGTVTVLFVHNVQDRTCGFAPATALGSPVAGSIHFIRGAVRTGLGETEGGGAEMVCELAPHGFAWLAWFDPEGR